MRVVKRAAAAVCAVVVLISAHAVARSGAAGQPVPNPPRVDAAALHGRGALAFVWQGRLYILDGPTRTLRLLDRSGTASSPSWSHDGQWVSWQLQSDNRIWLARRDGTGIHPLSVASGAVWSPTRDALAATPATGRLGGLWILRPGAPARRVARREKVQSFLWSPSGRSIAFVGAPISPTPRLVRQYLYSVDLPSGTVRRHAPIPSSRNNAIMLAGWWPDGKELLYWLDPQFSASLAADGLPLFTLNPASGAVRSLAYTLHYSDWLAPAPSGGQIAIVRGLDRSSYFGKHIDICSEGAATCAPLAASSGTVSEDPAWSPSGNKVAFVRATALPRTSGFATGAAYMRWIHSRTLWIAHPDGSELRQVHSAGNGVYDPAWSSDGRRLLFVRDNALWLSPYLGGTPARVAQLFPGRQLPPYPSRYWDISYYGKVGWTRLFSWYSG
ncbi:MAG TPA: hypothetical protein VF221_15875 [Chloroflexota bacterium]